MCGGRRQEGPGRVGSIRPPRRSRGPAAAAASPANADEIPNLLKDSEQAFKEKKYLNAWRILLPLPAKIDDAALAKKAAAAKKKTATKYAAELAAKAKAAQKAGRPGLALAYFKLANAVNPGVKGNEKAIETAQKQLAKNPFTVAAQPLNIPDALDKAAVKTLNAQIAAELKKLFKEKDLADAGVKFLAPPAAGKAQKPGDASLEVQISDFSVEADAKTAVFKSKITATLKDAVTEEVFTCNGAADGQAKVKGGKPKAENAAAKAMSKPLVDGIREKLKEQLKKSSARYVKVFGKAQGDDKLNAAAVLLQSGAGDADTAKAAKELFKTAMGLDWEKGSVNAEGLPR